MLARIYTVLLLRLPLFIHNCTRCRELMRSITSFAQSATLIASRQHRLHLKCNIVLCLYKTMLTKWSNDVCGFTAKRCCALTDTNTKRNTSKNGSVSFWSEWQDLTVCCGFALHTTGSSTVALQQYPPRHSSLKTVHRTVFLTLRPSQVQVLWFKIKNSTKVLITMNM